MNRNNKEYRTYNLLFPLWLLIWLPSYLWLILIPLNYLIDTAVTWYTLRDAENCKDFCVRNTWRICIIGFACDLLGSFVLLGCTILCDTFENKALEALAGAIMMNPFSNAGAFIVCLIVVAFTAGMIYLMDRKALFKAGLDIERAARSAKWLAILTAPYLFLFPSGMLY